MQKLKFPLIIFIFSLAIFWVARSYGADVSIAQLLAMPFLLLAICGANILGLAINRGILILAFLFGLSGVALSYNIEKLSTGGIFVARFDDDPLESESRIFRNHMSEILEPITNVKALRYPFPIASDLSANTILKSEQKDALIWGSSRWLNATIRYKKNLQIKDILTMDQLSNISLPELGNLYLIFSPNTFGLSFGKNAHTDVFLAFVLAAEVSESEPERESLFKLAGLTKSHWTTNAHKAYPLWRLGNLQLLKAIEHGEYEPGELDCALNNYQLAAAFLDNARQNLDLHSAILTNHAVALYIKSKLENKPELEKIYVYEFYKAKHRRKESMSEVGEVSIFDAVKENLLTLYKLGEYESEKLVRRDEKGIISESSKKAKKAEKKEAKQANKKAAKKANKQAKKEKKNNLQK